MTHRSGPPQGTVLNLRGWWQLRKRPSLLTPGVNAPGPTCSWRWVVVAGVQSASPDVEEKDGLLFSSWIIKEAPGLSPTTSPDGSGGD